MVTKPVKGNGVVILGRKLYDNAIQKIILDTSKFEKLDEYPTLKREASLQRFLRKLTQKLLLAKMNIINCMFPVLLLIVSLALLQWTNFPPVIHLLKFVQ